jgi:exopolysaccharide biosynthesis protein
MPKKIVLKYRFLIPLYKYIRFMKRISARFVFIIIVQILFVNLVEAQLTGFRKIKWEHENIAPGLVWKYSHTMLNDTVPQNFNILIINTLKRRLSLSYNPKKNIIVSTQANEAVAIAAVNAGFFNIQSGGSVTYIRADGKIIEPDTAIRWKRTPNMNGTMLIDSKGTLTISPVKTNNWYDSHTEYPDVLVTGPLLLSDNKKMPLPSTTLVTMKHPRTVLGRVSRNKIILLTLDGRTDQSTGMTLHEITDLMISLKCSDVVNLDGGGSTTMWISGKPFNGVVNMPCDNKKFDHLGERAVSDILTVK